MVPAVPGRQKYRHVHDVRGREPGGLHVELLLLRRVRREPEEREQGERDDNLTSVPLGNTNRRPASIPSPPQLVCLAIEFAGDHPREGGNESHSRHSIRIFNP